MILEEVEPWAMYFRRRHASNSGTSMQVRAKSNRSSVDTEKGIRAEIREGIPQVSNFTLDTFEDDIFSSKEASERWNNTSPEEKATFEKKLLRKLDFKIIPWLTLLYLISFLDRTNIGNAKILGVRSRPN